MYDPALGRWHTIDPLAEDYYSWSPYNYSMNSPIILIDPNGEGVWDVIKGIGKGVANWATNTATGLWNMVSKTPEEHTVDMMIFIAEVECVGVRQYAENVVDGVKQDVQEKVETIKNDENGEATAEIVTEAVLDVATLVVGTKGAGAVSKTKKGTEIVQRAMSKAELNATKSTGLLRGGRKGTHYASDAVNNTAKKAQKRLALPNKPEVKVTMEVPSGSFSTPSKVKPAFNQPGGGMERTATGNVPVVVKKVKEYKK